MRTFLAAIDDPAQGETVARSIVRLARRDPVGAVHLLNVQAPLDGYARRFLGRRTIRRFWEDEGRRALAGARGLLDEARLPYTVHIRAGEPAGVIADVAEELGVQGIVMADGGGGLLGGIMQRLLIARVIRRADVPVVIVKSCAPRAGPRLSTERWTFSR